MERFLVKPEDLNDSVVRVSGEEHKHLRTVLRLKAGDAVEVFDGAGRAYAGVLTDVSSDGSTVAIDRPVTDIRESPIKIVLGQGIPKSDKMDWITQKATELGVAAICPVSLTRCVVRLDEETKKNSRRERWQKVAAEAAKQCGRTRVPEVMATRGLKDFLRLISPGDLFLAPWEEGGRPLKEVFQSARPAGDAATLAGDAVAFADDAAVFILIGPEGGLTKEEIQACEQAGGKILTLGPRILRTETAGLALISALQYHWGDMG